MQVTYTCYLALCRVFQIYIFTKNTDKDEYPNRLSWAIILHATSLYFCSLAQPSSSIYTHTFLLSVQCLPPAAFGVFGHLRLLSLGSTTVLTVLRSIVHALVVVLVHLVHVVHVVGVLVVHIVRVVQCPCCCACCAGCCCSCCECCSSAGAGCCSSQRLASETKAHPFAAATRSHLAKLLSATDRSVNFFLIYVIWRPILVIKSGKVFSFS